MKYIAFVVVMLMTSVCFGAECTKIDDTTMRVVETVQNSTDITITQIKHELQGINNDLEVVDDRYAKAKEGLLKKKDVFTTLLTDAENLGIKEHISNVLDTD